MPLLLIAVLFRTIEALKAFDLVMGLTGGAPGDATETVAVRSVQRGVSWQVQDRANPARSPILCW